MGRSGYVVDSGRGSYLLCHSYVMYRDGDDDYCIIYIKGIVISFIEKGDCGDY